MTSRQLGAGVAGHARKAGIEGRLRLIISALFWGMMAASFIPMAHAQFTSPTYLPVSLSGPELFGQAVALSGDGSTAIVGAPGDNSNGAAFVFIQSDDGKWTLQQKLYASDAIPYDGIGNQGTSVAISFDGDTVLVGNSFDNNNKGAAWIWVRSEAGVWTEQQKLIGDPLLNGPYHAAAQGGAVALSGDGQTAFIGGSGEELDTGAVWVFTLSGTSWLQRTKLVAPGSQEGTEQGHALATSYNGNVLIVGAPGYGSSANGTAGPGMAWIWTRASGIWNAAPFAASDPDVSATAQQGSSVALSADGSVAFVGAIGDNNGKGSVIQWYDGEVFWEEISQLQVTSTGGEFGYSVATAGQMALVGEPSDGSFRGSAWVFPDPALSVNTTQDLTGAAKSGSGYAVALSAFGGTALVATPLLNSNTGGVIAYSAATTQIVIQTVPGGLPFTVDGAPFSSPQTVNLSLGQHSISVGLTVSLAPGTQYLFQNWSDGGAATHFITVTSAPASYTATFKTQYQLTLQASPAADGTVSPASGTFYDAGTVVPISAAAQTAPAGTHYVFQNWSDGGAASHSITMTGPMTEVASFKTQYQLTLQASPAADGTVTPASGTFYDAGTVVPISATAQTAPSGTRYVFSDWSDSGAASHSITMTGPMNLEAYFDTQYLLTTAASPGQGGTVTPGSGFYDEGDEVDITATANNGFAFTGWSSNVDSPTSQATFVTMNGPMSVIATFSTSSNFYGTAIQTSPEGLQFQVDTSGVQIAPQTLQLAAGVHTISVAPVQAGTSGTQNVFQNWSDGGAASHTITVTSAGTYTATFQTQYQLTIAASPVGGGIVTPASGTFYNAGAIVPITATPNSGYSFSSWSGTVANSANSSTTVTMAGPETVTANFTAGIAFFAGSVNGGGGTQYLQFPNGNVFGYYVFLGGGWLYHADLGYEYGVPGNGPEIYFWDLASGHWWYSNTSSFPYMYDFTLSTWIYYFPDTHNAGHYLSNPRYFANMTTGQIFTM